MVCRDVGFIAFNGKESGVGYLGDFRIAFDRRFAREWRKSYSEVLASRNEHFITAVIDENLRAQNAFVKRAKADFVYEKLTPYLMVNVLRRLPLSKKHSQAADQSLRFSRGTPADMPDLEKFLNEQERLKAFGYCFNRGELQRRMEKWDGLTAESFFILRDSSGILGCFAAWSPSQAKVNIVERLPWYFNLARPFLKVPQPGTALGAVYLTHLAIRRSLSTADRKDVFRRLFRFYYEGFRDPLAHLFSFCDFPEMAFHESLQGIRGGFLIQKIPMTLFTVRHTHSRAEALDPETCREPGFEIALV